MKLSHLKTREKSLAFSLFGLFLGLTSVCSFSHIPGVDHSSLAYLLIGIITAVILGLSSLVMFSNSSAD